MHQIQIKKRKKKKGKHDKKAQDRMPDVSKS